MRGVAVVRFDDLLDELKSEYYEAKRRASLAEVAELLVPIEQAGRTIRERRTKQGLTLEQLSDLSGVSYVTLSRVERGHLNVRLDSLLKALTCLGAKLWIG